MSIGNRETAFRTCLLDFDLMLHLKDMHVDISYIFDKNNIFYIFFNLCKICAEGYVNKNMHDFKMWQHYMSNFSSELQTHGSICGWNEGNIRLSSNPVESSLVLDSWMFSILTCLISSQITASCSDLWVKTRKVSSISPNDCEFHEVLLS